MEPLPPVEHLLKLDRRVPVLAVGVEVVLDGGLLVGGQGELGPESRKGTRK